jgi:CheY-like chemotaxis protein
MHHLMERQLTNVTRLVDDLLDVSRITRGKVVLRREHMVLRTAVVAAAEAASPAIIEGDHLFTMSLPDDSVWLYADPARLSQVLTNLLHNAAKFTPRGGDIRLEARVEGSEAVIRVRDSGPGIPPESLPRVFDMFVQVSPAGRVDGLGIGLALARQLVEMHGGTIEARSADTGQGAEFVVRLPLADEGREEHPGSSHSGSALGRRLKVLVVDDNADLVEMLATVVETQGHDPCKAFDGRSGISAAIHCRPDVVLLDLGLPDMDGCDVARALRREPLLTGVYLVALTGWGQDADRQRTREAGFDHHLTKPADPDTVTRLLSEVAARQA